MRAMARANRAFWGVRSATWQVRWGSAMAAAKPPARPGGRTLHLAGLRERYQEMA